MPSTLSWEERLAEAKNAGFDFVEISIDETDAKLARLDWSAAERLELVRTMDKVGLPIRSMCLSGHRKYPLGSPERGHPRPEHGDHGERPLPWQMIWESGSSSLPATMCTTRRAPRRPAASSGKTSKRAVEMAARRSVVLGFETMETEFMNTVEKSMRYVDAVNSLYLGVYPDLGNLTNAAKTYGTDVCEDIRLGIRPSHLHALKGDGSRRIPRGALRHRPRGF